MILKDPCAMVMGPEAPARCSVTFAPSIEKLWDSERLPAQRAGKDRESNDPDCKLAVAGLPKLLASGFHGAALNSIPSMTIC